MDHGDWSIVEHVSISVDMLVDRGITHELVRHRLFSFTQESTRFVNYEKKMPPSFIYPKPDVECKYCLEGQEPISKTINYVTLWEHGDVSCSYNFDWLEAITSVENKYKALLATKWRPQEARSVFPNALAARIIVTGNLRNWRHFFIMRTTQEAHPQMCQVTIPLLAEFKEKVPLLFDDIVPNAKQSTNLRLPR
jgi:thymidylate synthase (FAD)